MPVWRASSGTTDIRASDTHLIPTREHNSLLADSTNLGWRYVYASLARESPWSANVPAIPHFGIAFNIRNSTQVRRSLQSQGNQERAWLHPRQFSVLPADMEMHWQIEGHPDILLIYVHRKMFEQVSVEIFDRDPSSIHILPRLACSDPFIESMCLEYIRAIQGTPLLYCTKYMGLLTTQFVSYLIKNHSTLASRKASSEDDIVAEKIVRAKAYMQQQLSHPIGLNDIAGAAGMSVYHFIRTFKAVNGITPYQYLLKLRTEHAKWLLSAQHHALADVALECGFSNQSHFTNTFKKLAGVTPRSYRQLQGN